MNRLASASLLGVLLLLSVALLPALAATFHVSPHGSDATPCGQGPRRTITAGAACLGGGDTLIIASGTYDELVQVVLQGSPSAPTVLRAAPGATVVIRPTTSSNPTGGGILDIGGQYGLVEGLTVDGGWNPALKYGLSVAGRGHQVRGIEITRVVGQAMPVDGEGHHFDRICNHDNGQYDPAGPYEGYPGFRHGAYLYQGGSGHVIENSVFARMQDGYGIQSYAGNVTIRNNVLADNRMFGIVLPGGGTTVAGNTFARNKEGTILANNGYIDGGGNRADDSAPVPACGAVGPAGPVADVPPAPKPRPAPTNLRGAPPALRPAWQPTSPRGPWRGQPALLGAVTHWQGTPRGDALKRGPRFTGAGGVLVRGRHLHRLSEDVCLLVGLPLECEQLRARCLKPKKRPPKPPPTRTAGIRLFLRRRDARRPGVLRLDANADHLITHDAAVVGLAIDSNLSLTLDLFVEKPSVSKTQRKRFHVIPRVFVCV